MLGHFIRASLVGMNKKICCHVTQYFYEQYLQPH